MVVVVCYLLESNSLFLVCWDGEVVVPEAV